ncbi:hypothetical protein ACSXAY_19240 (plasmid) [Clostridium perfringens]
MRKKIAISLIIFLTFQWINVYSYETNTSNTKGENIIAKLNEDGKTHPRLLINKNIVKNLKEKIEINEDLKKQYNKVKSIADSYLNKEPVIYEILDGRRLLPVSRELVKRVQYLGLAYQLSGEEKYSTRLIKELERVCNDKFFSKLESKSFFRYS